jgi:hypothetical protein
VEIAINEATGVVTVEGRECLPVARRDDGEVTADEQTTNALRTTSRGSGDTQADEEPEVRSPKSRSEEPGLPPVTAPPPPDTDVYDMLRAAIGLFVQEAWIALGLQPRYGSPVRRQMDLRCAKVAIDTTQMLIEQLGGEAMPG